VGIVDDDGERLATIDPLHPAGTPVSLETRPTASGSSSQPIPSAIAASVVGVELPGEPERDRP
jgi:hypothetical protein